MVNYYAYCRKGYRHESTFLTYVREDGHDWFLRNVFPRTRRRNRAPLVRDSQYDITLDQPLLDDQHLPATTAEFSASRVYDDCEMEAV